MTFRLFCQAVLKFALGGAMVAALLFLSAGTVRYPQAQLFLALLLIPMFLCGLFLMVRNPALLRSRLQVRETRSRQSPVIRLSGLLFLAAFLSAGLSFRFGFWMLPRWVTLAGTVLFLLSYALYGEVLRENSCLSRTIRVQNGQTVVDTGLYSIVRHPMYAVTIVLFLSMPLVLGSALSFLCMLPYPFVLVGRIRDEETVLRQDLAGYEDYCRRIRWRLVPGLW